MFDFSSGNYQPFYPEGVLINTKDNLNSLKNYHSMQECIGSMKILEAPCIVCDTGQNLIVDLGWIKGLIPKNEGAIGVASGATKDIALISRVNKPVCFIVESFGKDSNGREVAMLSRRKAQEMCVENYISLLDGGDVIKAKVTHLEQFGCFVDIGCGIPSLIPIDAISVSRISHPSDRFYIGQNINAVVKCNEVDRICLSHKELLGTWEENADEFEVGETVTGIVRSIEDYGIFVELAPNLAGLAELRDNIKVNQHTSVYIKAIIPDKMKIKLIIVDNTDTGFNNKRLKYFITEGKIDKWQYSTDEADKLIQTVF